MYQSNPQKGQENDFVFTIVTPPSYGVLLLFAGGGHDLALVAPQTLRTGSTFTQVRIAINDPDMTY